LAFGVVMLLIGVAGLASSEPWSGAVILAVGCLWTWRGWRISRVDVTDATVRLHSLLRTRDIPFSQLTGIEVHVRGGPGPYRREYLLFRERGGRWFIFQELNARARRPVDQGNEVRRAAALIDARLSQQVAPTDLNGDGSAV
jgi:hypothetical protein